MVLTKSEDVAKQGFFKILRRKLRLREGLLLSLIGVFVGGSGVWWALLRGWAILTFSAFSMGSYSRWALIRGWALIPINTVSLLFSTVACNVTPAKWLHVTYGM